MVIVRGCELKIRDLKLIKDTQNEQIDLSRKRKEPFRQ